MAKNKKKKVSQSAGPMPQSKVNGNTPRQSNSPLTFDFSRGDWLKSIKYRDFTNKLDSETSFSNNIFEIFYKLIPNIQQNWNDILKFQGRGQWEHCHPIAEDKLDLVLNIIEEVHGHKFDSEKKAGPSLWQIGITQNIRLIAIHDYTNNHLTPVFVDYHHLIHPSKFFNQRDYDRYGFCPVCEYV